MILQDTHHFHYVSRESKLPIDVIFGLTRPYDEDRCTTKYIEKMKLCLREVLKQAKTAAKMSQNRLKTNYDLPARAATLKVGARVLIRIVAFDGKHKIADKWEDNPYRIISLPNEGIPVLAVRRQSGEGRCKVLHRNPMLSIGPNFQLQIYHLLYQSLEHGRKTEKTRMLINLTFLLLFQIQRANIPLQITLY